MIDLATMTHVTIDAECLRDVKHPYSFSQAEHLGNAVTCSISNEGEYKDWVGDGSITAFWSYIMQFDLIIGYNTIGFDYPLWGGSMWGPEHSNAKTFFEKSTKGKTVDLAKDFSEHFKHRVKLNNVSVPTLGDAKEMDGGHAPYHWRNGRCLEVIEYCRGDVRRTQELFLKAVRGEDLSLLTKTNDIRTFSVSPKIR